MTEIIELRPDKNLINLSFEKYQFSYEIVPIISENKLKNRKYTCLYYKLYFTVILYIKLYVWHTTKKCRSFNNV